MKSLKNLVWFFFILIVLGMCSIAGAAEIRKPSRDIQALRFSNMVIQSIEGNLITLIPENDRTKIIVMEVADTKGFNVGDKVQVRGNRIEKMANLPDPLPKPAAMPEPIPKPGAIPEPIPQPRR